MAFSESDYITMKARLEGAKKPILQNAPAASRETGKGGLHEQIEEWCKEQWPRWKIIKARADQRSTIAPGAQDMTIFGPYPLCLCVELKAKDGKLSDDQRIWATEMRCLGWEVFVVRSKEEFLEIVRKWKQDQSAPRTASPEDSGKP